jgi:Autotransporter beta-domain
VLGSIGSIATPSGPVNVASGAILGLRGSISSSGLTNNGTVWARGALNAPVVNNSAFNVTGNLTGTTTFTNNAVAELTVYSGTYALTGLLTNFNDVTVHANGGLTAGSLTNVSTGTIVNLGTVTDDLNNAGAVMNYGVYNANVASNTGAITNFASGAWNGNALNTGGTIENDGVWTGALNNMAGTLTNNGKIVGNITASGGTVNSFTSNSAITGNVTLPGSPAVMNALGVITGNVDVMAGSNGVYGGVFRVGDETGLLNPVGATPKTLTVNGSVSGPITMPVDLANGNSNYIKVTGSTANAAISLTGALTNPNNLLWTVPNRTLVYSNASIPLTLASDELLSGASRYGVYDYVPTAGNNGIAQQLKLGLVASPANQISALVTALNTSFFQDASALLGSPANPAPNTWHGGIWSRGGGAEVTTETTSTGGGAFSSADTRFQTSLGGVQFGLDGGLYNINASGMNVHLGITGGSAWGYSSENGSSDPNAPLNVSGSATMPFYGLYAAATGQGFSGTVQWRHNTFDMQLNNPDLGLHNSSLNANGNTFSAEAAYAIPLPYNFFLTPSAAVFVSNTGINNLYASPLAAPNTWFTFDNLNNTLLRVGGRLGMNYTFNDNLLVQPYLSGNFWHEFDGSTTTNFYQVSTAGLSTLPGIYSNGVGTFGQFAIGFSTQSPKSGFTSFVEADLQTGSNLQGWGLTAGLRYSY